MSTLFSKDLSPIIPEQVAQDLLITPLVETSILFNPAVSRTVITGNRQIRFPRITRHATAAWVAEGAEIPATDIAVGDEVIVPSKVAALSDLTRESAEDSDPAAQELLGQSMIRGIRERLDNSFLNSKNAPSLSKPEPTGLAGLTGATEATLDLTDLDSFVAAAYSIARLGGTATAYIVAPEDALTIATLKTATGSNQPLIEQNQPGVTHVNGLPLIVAPQLTTGTAYAVDNSAVIAVVRRDATVETSDAPHWSSDRISVRTTMRAAWGFADPACVVRMTKAAA